MTPHLLLFYVYQQLPVYVLLIPSYAGQLSLSLSLSPTNIHPFLVYSSSLNKLNLSNSVESFVYTFKIEIARKIDPEYVDPVAGATWTKCAP